jgi:pimeloyl-ACP methyl ester carboxylesterase
MPLFRLFATLLCLAAFSMAAPAGTDAPTHNGDACRYETLQVPALSLAGNKTGEATRQPVYVYLPHSYEPSGTRRYPVLYFFAGYYESSDIAYLARGVEATLRQHEFIVVSINDVNSLHGTFGANSPVTGNWRDFFLREAIPYIDAHYRTLATAEGRAVGGFSMGGHVALRLAFEHPEIFSTLYAVSPGVFDEHGLENAMKTWDQTFLNAYGAAYAPNLQKPFPHADYPSMDGSPEDLVIRARWKKGFGELPQLIDAYLAQPAQLKAIALEVGMKDEYPWIPDGCVYLNDLLRTKGLAHTFVITENRHEFDAAIFEAGMGPFIARQFSKLAKPAEAVEAK